MNVVYKVTRPHARVPEYAHDTDAGADLRTMEGCTLRSLERRLLPTGIAVQIPEGYYGAVVPRSGLAAKRGLTVLNAPGTIDSGYRGEVGVCLVNLSTETQTIEEGERIAQLIILPYEKADFIRSLELEPTVRGDGSFGSTGTMEGCTRRRAGPSRTR